MRKRPARDARSSPSRACCKIRSNERAGSPARAQAPSEIPHRAINSPMLEVLDGPLVFLRRLTARERPQVLALPCLLICMAAIDTKFAGFELTNHALVRCRAAPRDIHGSHRTISARI